MIKQQRNKLQHARLTAARTAERHLRFTRTLSPITPHIPTTTSHHCGKAKCKQGLAQTPYVAQGVELV
ncbi:hypothetical protein HBI56_220010 [Parastagonospora nodorum]|uniref:Uncharacterized protein n=1 Tax=Phaeosphaeria nodorum (strain SN15 / ATCC MYA-4574 / FGSC 10173) TaxID=321614 RepID=A0A7U2HVT4_PHANO|nr:hypothetical protein HBH56_006980 [Parastagonospora nodorum]QRC90511.1 hypothetical protein JI435_000230 [Parastagonospora nodorum SN15]KAH3922203.1 hypothetical protein HBH54_228800 [Parastagonospora nodorum]KAH3940235.1 hypothetical protein HBH53_220220 [Parastagonospora nodorum]KAH3960022.1 hypothetical protein HBH52_238890 [Parastagonospora nodorum]